MFSDYVSTSSSIFTADRFSDFSDRCYSSGLSTYTTNSVVPEGVLASSYSNVRSLYSCSSQITASSSVAVTEVQPFDGCTSGPPDSTLTLYTDASLTGWDAFLEGRKMSGVCEDCHLEEHINLLEMRAILLSLRHFQEVIQTVSVDSHRQCDSGGLSSESRGNSLLFSVSSMQRNYVAMRQSPDSEIHCISQAIRI
jgi:hypothetical protein